MHRERTWDNLCIEFTTEARVKTRRGTIQQMESEAKNENLVQLCQHDILKNFRTAGFSSRRQSLDQPDYHNRKL